MDLFDGEKRNVIIAYSGTGCQRFPKNGNNNLMEFVGVYFNSLILTPFLEA